MSWGNFKFIETDLSKGVLTVRLNRPDRLNCVNRQLHNELSRVFTDASLDPDCEIIVLTGNGRAFSAGGDLEFLQVCIEDPVVFDEVAYEGKKIVYSMLDCEKPIIGKVNGHAVGLGATLALFCDITFVADDAKISDPHVRVGLAAGDGGAVIWPQLIGYARAKELLMTGSAVTAPDAAAMGLINYAIPAADLDARVQAFVDRLQGGHKAAIAATKVSINVALKQLAHSVLETSTALERISNRSPEHRAAVLAMLRKETPLAGHSFNGSLLEDVRDFSGLDADNPSLAPGPDGDFLVAFQDQPLSATNTHIFGWLWGNHTYLPLALGDGQ